MKGGTAIVITIFKYRRSDSSWQEEEDLQNDKLLSGGTCKRLRDLIEVIEGWIALRLRLGDLIPPIKGISIILKQGKISRDEWLSV